MIDLKKLQIPNNISLVAISKTHPVKKIKKAVEFGVRKIGENRIQEAQEKYKKLKDFFKENNVEFHFVGHLQSNKAKKAVEIFDMIQSIDSVKIARTVNKRARQINKTQDVLVQVNIGREPQKYGIDPEKTDEFLNRIKKFDNLNVRGLMCIPPYKENPRSYFKKMKQIFDKTGLEILSMGMSSDYKIAIEEGSNMVRIGTKIFGERIK